MVRMERFELSTIRLKVVGSTIWATPSNDYLAAFWSALSFRLSFLMIFPLSLLRDSRRAILIWIELSFAIFFISFLIMYLLYHIFLKKSIRNLGGCFCLMVVRSKALCTSFFFATMKQWSCLLELHQWSGGCSAVPYCLAKTAYVEREEESFYTQQEKYSPKLW